jgi:hypothetical protein
MGTMDLPFQARVAAAELLAAARFGPKSHWAAARAQSQIAACRALLLSQ